MMKNKQVQIAISLPSKLLEEITSSADETGLRPSAYMRMVIIQHLKHKEKEHSA